MRILLVLLVLLISKSAAGQRCSLPSDLYVFMRTLDSSSQCLQDYQNFMNPENVLSARMQSADRWCRQCAQPVQHWYDDICVELTESAKIGHLCASNGQQLCYFVAQELAVFNATELAITCGLEYQNGTRRSLPDTCTPDCRSALQQAVNRTGCCFESAFNVSDTPEISRRLASYQLWDSCGMNTNSVDYCPRRIGTRNCTETDTFLYLQTLDQECVADFVIQLRPTPENFDDRVSAAERWCANCAPTLYNWLLNECGDEIDALELAHVCGHDGNRNCFHYTMESRFYQTPVETCRLRSNQTYLPFPSTCPQGCADALQQLSNDLGCCFESAFNATDTLTIQFGLANNGLWNTCGLSTESANFCPNPFTDAVPAHVPNVSIMVFLVTLVSLTKM